MARDLLDELMADVAGQTHKSEVTQVNYYAKPKLQPQTHQEIEWSDNIRHRGLLPGRSCIHHTSAAAMLGGSMFEHAKNVLRTAELDADQESSTRPYRASKQQQFNASADEDVEDHQRIRGQMKLRSQKHSKKNRRKQRLKAAGSTAVLNAIPCYPVYHAVNYSSEYQAYS